MATPLDPEVEALRFLAAGAMPLVAELVGEGPVFVELGEGPGKLGEVVCASMRMLTRYLPKRGTSLGAAVRAQLDDFVEPKSKFDVA